MADKKTFGKFKRQLSSGNKNYHCYLSGEVDGKDVSYHAECKGNNRDEAFAVAKAEFRRRNPGVTNIAADHIGLDKLTEATDADRDKIRWEATFSMQSGAGRWAETKVITRYYMAHTEEEAREKAKAWLETADDYGKLLDVDKATNQNE